MPEVNGMRFPYTKEGKAAAKKVAAKSMRKNKKKQNWSGVRSQVYGG
jgi:DNA-binding protein H-NS